MFTKVPVLLKTSQKDIPFDALVNVANILTVFPNETGVGCSAMMVGGHKITIDMPFSKFSERLLELRKNPLDS
jgi:hypothetical protein